jgi:D-amino-acid dehydrogenase
MTAKRVGIVGAGSIGLCTAYYLHKRGMDVVVVDRGRAGHGASFANGGWICPAQSGPLPEPGLPMYAVRSFFDHESPLELKIRALPGLAPWLFRLWRNCNARSYQRGVEAIARFGLPVFDQIDEMLADGVEFDVGRAGALVAAKDPAAAQGMLDAVQPMRRFGYRFAEGLVRGEELHELEPALSQAITSGWVLEQQVTVDPAQFTAGLARWLRANGVEILEGAEVTAFVGSGTAVRAVRTPTEEIRADAFVLAAGAWTRDLASRLRLAVPIVAGKGYSFFITPSIVPRRALYLLDLFAGATPFGERVRIGGVLEFSGLNLEIDKRRIQSMMRSAREALVEWARPDVENVWAGARPMTPDGLPIIDRSPLSNVYISSGHSFQGVSLGPPTGKDLAELIVTGRRPESLDPFRFERFDRPR